MGIFGVNKVKAASVIRACAKNSGLQHVKYTKRTRVRELSLLGCNVHANRLTRTSDLGFASTTINA